VALLVRTSRSTSLTDAGVAALDNAVGLLERLDRMRAAAADAARRGRGEVTAGFIASTVGPLLAPLVQRVGAEHPELVLHVSQVRVGEVVARVRDGRLDLAFARVVEDAPDLLQRTVMEEPVLAVIPVGHPLAGRATVSWADFDGEGLVMLDPRVWPPARRRIDAAAFTPAETVLASSHATAIALVATGAGLYQLPLSAATPAPGVVFVPIEGAASRIVLVRRAEPPTPPLAAVLAVLERGLAAERAD
jgi:DNA-binding transcriptional LysR family regulator